MATHQELLKLSQDIEVLKNAGFIKAASVLHKKFIKESQAQSYVANSGVVVTKPEKPNNQTPPAQTQPPAQNTAQPSLPPNYDPYQNYYQDPRTGGTVFVDPGTGQPFQNSQGLPSDMGKGFQVTPPGTYQNPGGDTQRGYGNQQSQDQELQYLQNELKRLQEQYGESCGPFAAQCNTIRDMIQRNQGGNVIRKSTNMNKFEKLAKLNKDIEVLENAGKFQAAEILQKKFLKEAQDAFGGLVTQDAKNFMMELDKAYSSGQSTLGVMQKAERAGLPPQELQILKGHANKLSNQAKNEFDSKYPNTGYQTSNNTVAPSTQAPSGQTDNFQNYYTEQSDTANFYQQQNSNPNADKESEEQKLYMQSLNEIINAFSKKDRNAGEAIFNNTLKQFTNPKRKKAFSDQIQRQRTKYFAGKYNQGPTMQ